MQIKREEYTYRVILELNIIKQNHQTSEIRKKNTKLVKIIKITLKTYDIIIHTKHRHYIIRLTNFNMIIHVQYVFIILYCYVHVVTNNN